jgi:superfamily II DNA or RNA helicase
MEFAARKPGVGYIGQHLWLPKTRYNALHMDRMLRYADPLGDGLLTVWHEAKHHYLVPRNFLNWLDITRLKFPIYDVRFDQFPEVNLKSCVQLDAQDPTKTFQQEGSDALLHNYDGILTLRCGAGKTVVGLHTASLLRVPIMVIVDEKALAQQWREEIVALLGVAEDDIGSYQGQNLDWEKPICIGMVQTLARRAQEGTVPDELRRHFGVAMFDEAHCMGAPYFNGAAPIFAGRRWGLSATPERDDEFDSLLKYTLGNVVFSYLIPETMPTFHFYPGGGTYPTTAAGMNDISVGGKIHYTKLFGHLSTQEKRTTRIVRLIQRQMAEGREILILSSSRAMIENLGAALQAAGLDPGIAHGGVTDAKKRRDQINNHNPVLATMRIGKQALDKSSLDTLCLCDPVNKDNVLQQTMGRILRIQAAKHPPEVWVIEDAAVAESRGSCRSMRKKLLRWPAHKGGEIKYVNHEQKGGKGSRFGRKAKGA